MNDCCEATKRPPVLWALCERYNLDDWQALAVLIAYDNAGLLAACRLARYWRRMNERQSREPVAA